MKKVFKSDPPNSLTNFQTRNPGATWEEFRDNNQGNDYRKLKKLIFDSDQGKLCAYCEVRVDNIDISKRRIEHIHNKSSHLEDGNTKNWALDWDNVIGVCLGGSDSNRSTYQLPRNLSCDSFKDHKNIDHNEILNPLQVTSVPSYFSLDKRNGNLMVNNELQDDSLKALVEKTIRNLNLNCDRLCANRLEILKLYNREIKKARDVNNRNIFEYLCDKWFSHRWQSFFTTRRILLGSYAENYLQSIYFDG